MSQFHAHKNLDESTQQFAPYVLDIQSSLLHGLQTVVALPLIPADKYLGKQIKGLNPILKIDNEAYICSTQNIFSIERNDMGRSVADFSQTSHEIVAAMDYALSGV